MNKESYDGKKLNIDESRKIKLIQSDNFKVHMEAHKNDFTNISYEKLIEYIQENQYLSECNEEVVEMVIEFPFEVGYTHVREIGDEDFIVYAKRLYRNLYSKFTLNRTKRITNKCVLILRKNTDNEYIIITMFPGECAVREVQDKKIKTEAERKRVVEFWDRHAFAYDVNIIDPTTITDKCPYESK